MQLLDSSMKNMFYLTWQDGFVYIIVLHVDYKTCNLENDALKVLLLLGVSEITPDIFKVY